MFIRLRSHCCCHSDWDELHCREDGFVDVHADQEFVENFSICYVAVAKNQSSPDPNVGKESKSMRISIQDDDDDDVWLLVEPDMCCFVLISSHGGPSIDQSCCGKKGIVVRHVPRL